MTAKPTVAFANNNPGQISSSLFESFTLLHTHDIKERGYLDNFIVVRSGGLLSIYRNKVVAQFLDKCESEWLWFVDSDICLETDTLDRLLECAQENDCAILGALYFSPEGTIHRPLIYKRKRTLDGGIKIAPVYAAWDPWPRDTLLEVDAVGLGCTIIHRDVLTQLLDAYPGPEPWFGQDIDEHGVLNGEDITFCMRAKKLGFPSYLHTGIEVGHEKMTLLSSKTLGLV